MNSYSCFIRNNFVIFRNVRRAKIVIHWLPAGHSRSRSHSGQYYIDSGQTQMTGVSYQNDRCFQTAILMWGWNLQKINKYINDKHYIDQKFYNIEWIFEAAETRDPGTTPPNSGYFDHTVWSVRDGLVRGPVTEICACIDFIKNECSIKWSKDCRINNQNQNYPIPHSLK